MQIFCDERLFFLLLKTKRANALWCHLTWGVRAGRVVRTRGWGLVFSGTGSRVQGGEHSHSAVGRTRRP